MDNKKMVHPALTEFALMQAKDWEAVAQERLGVIERMCMEVEVLREDNKGLRDALEAIIDSKCVQPWIGIAWTKALAALSAKE